MRFRNRTSDPLAFDFDARNAFTVEPGGYVEIPDRLAFCVKLHGLPLDEAPETGAASSGVADAASPDASAPAAADETDADETPRVRPPPPMPKRKG